ncbi:MAG: hypothetical protein N7Q72_02075, partial [Spiroplasma sp. Tabriz.8]|nr:hypothetical protein [Spiroplasma sp. Tabriz.8]
SSDASSLLHYPIYGNGTTRVDASSKGTQNKLLERQVIFLFVYLFIYLFIFNLNDSSPSFVRGL